jgi:hypothetical protein
MAARQSMDLSADGESAGDSKEGQSAAAAAGDDQSMESEDRKSALLSAKDQTMVRN